MRQMGAILIMNLEGPDVGRSTNNQLVVVNYAEGVVSDGVEQFKIWFTAETIGFCVWDGFTIVRIVWVL